MQDLGTLPGGMNSAANAINNSGQVVGYSGNSSSPEHAFLYSVGTMQDLGTLSGGSTSCANAINNIGNIGQVVGWSQSSSGTQHAFLYSRNDAGPGYATRRLK